MSTVRIWPSGCAAFVAEAAWLFARYAIGTRAHDANTLRYLWIEASYDASERRQA